MKLVIYNKQNSQPVGQRNGERTLRFNRENGMIYISKSFAAELGIKDIDKVQFANDEENTKDWFICKTDSEQGFSIKYDKGGIRFMNKFLSNKILDCAKVKDNASFLMEKEPITVDGTKYFKIMLSSPIIVKRSPSKKATIDKQLNRKGMNTFYMVFVEGCATPACKHDSLDSAEKEAKRLATLLKKKVYVLCTIKSVEDTQYKIEDCRPGESDLPF